MENPRQPGRVGIIDLGSNTLKALVAEVGPEGTLQTVFARTEETRLGGFLEHSPVMPPETLRAGVDAVGRLLAAMRPHQPHRWTIVATSAVREMANQAEFLDAIEHTWGLRPRVLSGEEEALGVARGVACDPALSEVPDFHLVDIGGGSLELVHVVGTRPVRQCSLALGAVRLTRRFVEDIEGPLDEASRHALQAHVRDTLLSSWPRPQPATVLVGTGGVFNISRAILGQRDGLTFEDAPHWLPLPRLDGLLAETCQLPLADRRAIPHLPPARADIFPVALGTVIEIARYLQGEGYRHSSFNLRYGIAAEWLFEQR